MHSDSSSKYTIKMLITPVCNYSLIPVRLGYIQLEVTENVTNDNSNIESSLFLHKSLQTKKLLALLVQ